MTDNAYLAGYELGREYGRIVAAQTDNFQLCVERAEDWAAQSAKTPLGHHDFTEEEWHLWGQGVFDGAETEYTKVHGGGDSVC